MLGLGLSLGLSSSRTGSGAASSAKPLLSVNQTTQVATVSNAATFTGGLVLYADGASQGAVTSPFSVASYVGKDIYVAGTETGKSATNSDVIFVTSLPTLIEGFDFTANNGTYLSGYMERPGYAGGNVALLTPFFTLTTGGTYAYRTYGYNEFPNSGGTPYDPFKCQSGSLQLTVDGTVTNLTGATYYQGSGLGTSFQRDIVVPLGSLGSTEWIAISMVGIGSDVNSASQDFVLLLTPSTVSIARRNFSDGSTYNYTHGLTGDVKVSYVFDYTTQKARISLNDVELPTFGGTGGYTALDGIPLNNGGTTLSTTGLRPGYVYKYFSAGNVIPQNKPLAKSDKFYTPVSEAVAFSNASFNRGVYTFDVAGPVGMTSGQKALFDSNFVQITAWSTTSCTAGVATGVTISDLSGVPGAHYIVFRNAANHAQLGVLRATATPYQSGNSIMAINTSDLLRENPTTNLFHQFGLYPGTDVATLGLTSDGRPTIMPAGGIDWIADYQWPDDPASPVFGTYDMTFTSGLVPSATATAYFSITSVTATTAVLTIAHGVDNPVIHWAGSLPADPNNLVFKIIKQGTSGANAARFYRPNVRTSLSGFEGYRYLFSMLAWPGDPQPIASTYQQNATALTHRLRNGAAPCPDVILDLVQSNNKKIIFNVPHYWTPQLLRDYMTLLIAGCSSKISVRYSNEVWNSALPTYHLARTTRNFTACNRAPTEGQYVIGAWSGYKAYVCQWNIKTGSTGASNGAGYFHLIDDLAYDNPGFFGGEPINICDASGSVLFSNVATYDATDEGQPKRLARRTRWMIDLIKALPTYDAARFEFGVEWQFNDGAWATVIDTIYAEETVGSELKSLSNGPYGDWHVLNWVNQDYMTQAEKSLVTSNPTSWLTKVKAAQLANNSDVFDRWKVQSDAWAAKLVANSRDQNAAPLGAYEASPNGEYDCTYPSIYFTNGSGTAPAAYMTYKGRTSGLIIIVKDTNHGGDLTIASGSFAGNNAVGNFHAIDYNYNGSVRYPTSGETFDRVSPSDLTTVLESASFVAANATNMNYDATVAYVNYIHSSDFGDVYADFIDKFRMCGTIGLFDAGGAAEGADLYSQAKGFGWWGVGSYDDLTSNPYAKAVAKIAATA